MFHRPPGVNRASSKVFHPPIVSRPLCRMDRRPTAFELAPLPGGFELLTGNFEGHDVLRRVELTIGRQYNAL